MEDTRRYPPPPGSDLFVKKRLGWFDLNLWVVCLVAGEWRITSYGSQIMGSMDFKSWCVLVWLVCFGCTDGLSAL